MKFHTRSIGIFLSLIIFGTWIISTRNSLFVVKETRRNYSFYLCTQIYNESEHYIFDWLDHQFHVIGFQNVCIINVGTPLSRSLREKFSFAYVEKQNRAQEFQYCLSSCFIDKPMEKNDFLMIHDIDEYLNVRQVGVIAQNHDQYDMFHFYEIRYGFVMNNDSEIMNRSIRSTNLWRKPHPRLGEYVSDDLKALFKCKRYDGWPACEEGNGKEMIRVGTIRSLSTHFHRSLNEKQRRFYVDMKDIRLNHYMMRTKQDAYISASKWKKLPSRLGQIEMNPWFRFVFDDSILNSQRLT